MSDMDGIVEGKKFCISVDAIVIQDGKVLLIKRNTPPFVGSWALPGGKVGIDELLVDAVKREAKEEAGIYIKVKKRIGVYDALDRDPLKRAVSVAFLCTTESEPKVDGKETIDVQWFPLDELPELAFDHVDMIRDATDKINPIVD